MAIITYEEYQKKIGKLQNLIKEINKCLSDQELSFEEEEGAVARMVITNYGTEKVKEGEDQSDI